MVFDWYKICNEEDRTLQQGDFVLECTIVIPPVILNEGDTLEMDGKKIDSIVLSQAFARYFMRVGLPQDLVVEYDY